MSFLDTQFNPGQVAELIGCHRTTVLRKIRCGQIGATQIVNNRNQPEYQISISSLPPSAQEKYYAQQRAALALNVEPETAEPKASKPFDAYNEAEREEIVFWEHVVQQWGGYARKKGESEAELLERFLAWLRLEYPERSWSKATLYRKRKALEDGDLDGLVDGRGKTKGSRVKLEPEVAEVFRAFYLQETRRPNVQEAMWGAEEYLAAHMPDKLPLPSYSTFYRYAQSIPPQLRELGIYGEKAWRDKYGLYISRDYSNLCSNDYWVSDSHTFDVLSKAPGGKPRKLYLTAFIDARSGIYTGWYVTDNPCAQATLFALRRGIERHGIPRKILSDNGREFLTRDVGGLGHRAKKPKPGAPVDPPPIFKRLGIQLVCAKVRNAQAKPIERKFLDMKGQFSTLWETFTGGNPTEKPECLKKVLKQGHVPTDEEFVEAVDTLISGYFNMRRYSGPIAEDRELKRMDVFHLRMGSELVKPASKEDLALMMLRSTRPQTVGQRGVHVTVSGVRFEYFTPEFLWEYADKKVYVRYDPDHLQTCRVYTSPDDRFICELPLDTKLTVDFDGSSEDIARAMAVINKQARMTKAALKDTRVEGIDRRTMLELKLGAARREQEEYVPPATKTPIRMKYSDEKQAELDLRLAVGQVDMGQINRNRMMMKGETDDGDDW